MHFISTNDLTAPTISDLLEQFQKSDIKHSLKLIREIQNTDNVWKTFYILSARSDDFINTQIYLDAARELTEKLFNSRSDLLHTCLLKYFRQKKFAKIDTSLMNFGTNDIPQTVLTSDFGESLINLDRNGALKNIRDILYAIESPFIFNELLFMAGIPFYYKKGLNIILMNTVAKALQLFKWKNCEEILIRTTDFLINMLKKEPNPVSFSKAKQNLKYSDYFIKASVHPGIDGENLLFITHARQIFKSVSVRTEPIHQYLEEQIKHYFKDIENGNIEQLSFSDKIIVLKSAISDRDIGLSLSAVKNLFEDGMDSNNVIKYLMDIIYQQDDTHLAKDIIYLNAVRRTTYILGYPRNMYVLKSFLIDKFNIMENSSD